MYSFAQRHFKCIGFQSCLILGSRLVQIFGRSVDVAWHCLCAVIVRLSRHPCLFIYLFALFAMPVL